MMGVYLLELREFHCTCSFWKAVTDTVNKGDVVVVNDEGHPGGLWRPGRIVDVIQVQTKTFEDVRESSKKRHTDYFGPLCNTSTHLKSILNHWV